MMTSDATGCELDRGIAIKWDLLLLYILQSLVLCRHNSKQLDVFVANAKCMRTVIDGHSFVRVISHVYTLGCPPFSLFAKKLLVYRIYSAQINTKV